MCLRLYASKSKGAEGNMKMNKKLKKRVSELDKHFTAEITREYKDGSARLTITYDKVFTEFVKEFYGKKKCTKKMVEKFVIDGLEKGMEDYERNQN